MIRRVLCQACGSVQTDGSLLPLRLYLDARELDQSTTASRRELSGLAKYLISKFHLQKTDLVLDIGSNDGTLLQEFQSRGHRVLGVEPAAVRTSIALQEGVLTIHGQFGPLLGRYLSRQVGSVRLLVARHLLGMLPDVNGFLQAIANLLEPDGAAVLQVRHALSVYSDLGGEMIHAMSPCAISVRGLAAAGARCGLTLTSVQEGSPGSGSVFVTLRPAASPSVVSPCVREHLEREASLSWGIFARRWNEVCRDLHLKVKSIVRLGGRVAGFSASPDAISLLHAARLGPEHLEAIVDPSLVGHGMWTSVAALPIVSADRARTPDVLVVLDRKQTEAAVDWCRRHPPAKLLVPFSEGHDVPHCGEPIAA